MLTIKVVTSVQEKYNLPALGKVSEGYTGNNGERVAYVDLPRLGISTSMSKFEAEALGKALLEVAEVL